MKQAANSKKKLNQNIEVVLGQMTDDLVEVTVTFNGSTFTDRLPLNGGKLTLPLSETKPLSVSSVLAAQNDLKAQQRQHTKNDVDRKRKQLMKKRDRDGLR